ncbi:hypothetical protein MD484_g365, partial [Candolleomyces efflorescens]
MQRPYPESSIPTPPFTSPAIQPHLDGASDYTLTSTIPLLDSLIAYYQHERMWVYRTRAQLENGLPGAPSFEQSFDQSLSLPSNSSYLDVTGESSDSLDDGGIGAMPQASTRWTKRKKGFKMRLEGLSPTAQQARQPLGSEDTAPSREQILVMFEKMMESRIESCQRINKLVRDANRAGLHSR